MDELPICFSIKMVPDVLAQAIGIWSLFDRGIDVATGTSANLLPESPIGASAALFVRGGRLLRLDQQ